MNISEALDAMSGLFDSLYMFYEDSGEKEILTLIEQVEETIINYVKSKGDYR